MIKIALCDDDEKSLALMNHYLNCWQEESQTSIQISLFHDGDEFINKLSSSSFDIVFMDIFMPLLNGMDAAKEMRKINNTIQLVFLTTSPDYALESYSVKANNYFLKPVSYEQIKQFMDEVSIKMYDEQQSLFLKTQNGYQKIYLNQIEFIEAYNKNVQIFMKSGSFIKILEPLYRFESQLSEEMGFFKCHRSYLVNMENVDYFSSKDIQTKSGKLIPIARGMAKNFENAYFTFMFK